MTNTSLIVVDVQNDFCEGGSLAVGGGNAVAERIADLLKTSAGSYGVIVLTRDWHNAPPDDNDGHFALGGAEPDYENSWPVHCVANTPGAEFHPAVDQALVEMRRQLRRLPVVLSKGQGRADYSGAQGRDFKDEVVLPDLLERFGTDRVEVVGLAGDFCVRATALDMKKLGYDVDVRADMIASVGGDAATVETVDMMYD